MTRTNSETSLYTAQCNTCTIMLVELCFQRAWWFKAFRTPMVWGMRLMCRFHGIDPRKYAVSNQKCYGCVRFMKVALKEKSPTFRALNGLINPIFNKLRNRIVTEKEIAEAKRFAQDAFDE
jgi:hypothetical protein